MKRVLPTRLLFDETGNSREIVGHATSCHTDKSNTRPVWVNR